MTWEDSLITVYIIAYISTGYSYNFNGGNIEKEDVKNDKVQNSRAKNCESGWDKSYFPNKKFIFILSLKKKADSFQIEKNSNNLDLWLLVVWKNNLWFQFTDFIIYIETIILKCFHHKVYPAICLN